MKKIQTLVSPYTTKMLKSIYKFDINGYVHESEKVKTLSFSYKWPWINFLIPIFKSFFENIDSQYIFMTSGRNVTEYESYLKFDKKDFMEFIESNETYITTEGYKHQINDYYIFGLTIFDENLTWLIHFNSDEDLDEGQGITLSYQHEKLNTEAIEILKKSEWFCE